MEQKLFIGLDIGTDSVGWAATDENFKLRRLKGKTAWGARLFSEASDAKSRRTFRSSGRRLARRKERIRLLNTLFDPLIKEKDPTFLLRLEYSMFQNDDENKPVEAKCDCPLFINKKEEKEYYKKYPTIWHLRKALINDDDEAFSDIRLLYLAIHHIIKYRGNFIKSGDNDGLDFDKSAYFSSLNDALKDLFDTQEYDEDAVDNLFTGLPESSFDEFLKIAEERKLGKKEKQKKLLSLMVTDDDSKPFIEMFCTLCTGGTFSIKKLNKKGEELYSDEKVVFNASYDENEQKFKDALGDAFAIVEIAKAVYDFCDLKDILNNHKLLSDAFVGIYDSHKEELSALKQICKYIDKEHGFTGDNSIFVQLFNQRNNAKNYPAFTHNKTDQKRCDVHTFDNYVMELLMPYDEELQNSDYSKKWCGLKALAKEDHLLQTIALRSTSVIPNQLHKVELQKILDNAVARKIPGIDKDFEDKLIALFKYRIPYYCGPLTTKSKYSKVVFNNDTHERITPWNFEMLINFDETKKKFMDGLTNKCTYLKKENVLPLGSILYQDFDAWNKLNNLMVNGKKLTLEEASQLFYGNLVYRKKSTIKDIAKILSTIKNSKESDISISGLNANDFINCSSRAALSKEFNLSHRYTDDYKTCERAIFLKTIYCDSPSDADASIKREFPNLTTNQLKALSKLVCKKWATLSEKLLTLKPVDKNGEVANFTLIDAMENCEGNFMQVFAKYNFQERVDIENSECFKNMTKQQIAYGYIENMPPKMRRPVIQAVRIVNEIAKVAKQDPDSISIEVTRENNDSKARKKLTNKADARKKQIENFLKKLVEVDPSEKERADAISEELESQELTALKGKHLFLYFMQNGKDVYSGKPIDINDVLKGNNYDTDHIIPQSLMKDDSIDNLVLVKKETNQHRSNKFPLPEEIRCDRMNIQFWKSLKKAGMMSDKKYNNLTRSTPLTDEEIQSFVAAQINVVNHSNVVVRDVLKTLYPNARLIFSKAQYPSQIRQELMIPKLRDLNDTHHAVDAYLNIVSGVKLTNRFGNIITAKAIEKENKKRMEEGKEKIDMSYNMTNYINHAILNADGTQTDLGKLIDSTSRRRDFLLTYRFEYSDDSFYNQTMYKKNQGDSLIPVHENFDPSKYGGYSGMNYELNCIATINGRKGSKRYLLAVPHLLITKAKNGNDITDDLISLVPHKEGEMVSISLNDSLPLAASVKKDGVRYLAYSSNSDQIKLKPVTPTFLTRESENYVYALTKAVEKYPDILSSESKEITLFTDREKSNKFTFNVEKTLNVANELFDIAIRKNANGKNKYEYCPMINELISPDFRDAKIQEILSSSFKKQLDILKYLIGVFTRKSEALSNKRNFRKSRASILQDDLTLCSDSITGLYTKERKI